VNLFFPDKEKDKTIKMEQVIINKGKEAKNTTMRCIYSSYESIREQLKNTNNMKKVIYLGTDNTKSCVTKYFYLKET